MATGADFRSNDFYLIWQALNGLSSMATIADFKSYDLYLIYAAIAGGASAGSVTIVEGTLITGAVNFVDAALIGKSLSQFALVSVDGIDQNSVNNGANIIGFDDTIGSIEFSFSLPYETKVYIIVRN